MALLAAVCLAGAAQANCRQALALGLDVSGSVDAREYRLQVGGIAQALDAPEVRKKLLAMPSAPVHIMIFEWSGPGDHHVLLHWNEIDSAAAIDIAVETLRQTTRRQATPGTALGTAMTTGKAYLDQRKTCWKRTLDISGDGKSNLGPRPRDVRDGLVVSGITINALVVGVDDPDIGDIRQTEISELSAYFRAEVILGKDAFVETAIGFSDYARAIKQKLLRELDGLVFSQGPAAQGGYLPRRDVSHNRASTDAL